MVKIEGATGGRLLEGKVRAEVDIGTGWCQAQKRLLYHSARHSAILLALIFRCPTPPPRDRCH